MTFPHELCFSSTRVLPVLLVTSCIHLMAVFPFSSRGHSVIPSIFPHCLYFSGAIQVLPQNGCQIARGKKSYRTIKVRQFLHCNWIRTITRYIITAAHCSLHFSYKDDHIFYLYICPRKLLKSDEPGCRSTYIIASNNELFCGFVPRFGLQEAIAHNLVLDTISAVSCISIKVISTST